MREEGAGEVGISGLKDIGGLVDIHTHLHPPWLFKAIRRWFAERSTWRLEHPTEPAQVAAALHAHGIARFVFFSYAHKAGLAREINAWLADTARGLPGAVALGTVHPDDADCLDVAEEALAGHGFPGLKVHINVQRFAPDDPRMLPVYERVRALGRFVLMHVGTAPWPGAHDGFDGFARLMARLPDLRVVVAHMGAFETPRFLEALTRHPNLHLDTTMAFAEASPLRVEIGDDDLVRWQDRICFGSDFPNLPYAYEEERRPLWRRGLPAAVYAKIFRDNALRLLEGR